MKIHLGAYDRLLEIINMGKDNSDLGGKLGELGF